MTNGYGQVDIATHAAIGKVKCVMTVLCHRLTPVGGSGTLLSIVILTWIMTMMIMIEISSWKKVLVEAGDGFVRIVMS